MKSNVGQKFEKTNDVTQAEERGRKTGGPRPSIDLSSVVGAAQTGRGA